MKNIVFRKACGTRKFGGSTNNSYLCDQQWVLNLEKKLCGKDKDGK